MGKKKRKNNSVLNEVLNKKIKFQEKEIFLKDIITSETLEKLRQENPEILNEDIKGKVDGNKLFDDTSDKIHPYVPRTLRADPINETGNVVRTVSEKELVKEVKNNKVCIISGDPGIGKSTILKSIYDQHKEEDPSCICIRRNLNEILLKKQYDNEDNPIDFLIKNMLKNENEFIKGLVRYNKNLIVFFDGCGDITSNNGNFIDFMKKLEKQEEIKKIYITTRPYHKEVLEEKISVLAYTIKNFSPEEEEQYLCEYYKEYGVERVKIYVKELIRLLHDSTENFNLIGNPLFLSMTARIFEKNDGTTNLKECDSIEKFVKDKTEKPKLSIELNLYTLYDVYVDKILYEYEKKNEQEILQRKNSRIIHGKYALLTVVENKNYSDDIQQRLDTIRNEFRSKCNIVQQQGIIIKPSIDNNDNIPVFIHKSFAEYFAATHFIDNIDQFSELVFSNILCEPNYKNLRLFLNHISEEKNYFDIIKRNNEIPSEILKNIFHVSSKERNFHIMSRVLELYKKEEVLKDILNERIDGDKCPLHHAVEHSTQDVVKLLIECGAEKDAVDKYGNTASHFAVKRNSIDLLEIFNPQKLNMKNLSGNTLLHWAAKFNHVGPLEYLLRNEQNDINCRNNKRKSVLHWAINNYATDVLDKLLNHTNIDLINCIDKRGNTPLHMAVFYKNKDMIKRLLEKNPSSKTIKTIRNKDNETPYDIAKILNDSDILELFHNNCGHDELDRDEELLWSAKYHKDQLTEILLKNGANVNNTDEKKRTALHWATRYNALKVVKQLLKRPDININLEDVDKETALHVAVNHRRKDIIELLLKQESIKLDITNKNGDTALYLAKLINDKDILNLFKGLNISGVLSNEEQNVASTSGRKRPRQEETVLRKENNCLPSKKYKLQ